MRDNVQFKAALQELVDDLLLVLHWLNKAVGELHGWKFTISELLQLGIDPGAS